MAISEMQKVRMAVHKTVSDEVMSRIQKLGCCHFITDGLDKVNENDIAPLRARMKKVDEMLGDVKFASRFIEPFADLKGAAPESFSMSALAAAADEKSFKPTSEKLHALEKRLSDVRANITRVNGLLSQTEPLKDLPCSLDFYSTGSDGMQGTVCAVQTSRIDGLTSVLRSVCADMADVYALQPNAAKDTSRIVSVIYPRDKAAEVQDALAKVQASRVDVPQGIQQTAAEAIVELGRELDALKKTEAEVVAEITASAGEDLKKCRMFQDYWTIQKNRTEALIEGEQTEQISIYSFWIPKDMVDRFKSSVAEFKDLMDIAIENPKEGELPPTLLHNKGLAGPVEPLISMYGTPTYGGLDPSAIVAPFFYMFFGICFGDAGYGLLIAALLIFIMIKKRLTGAVKKFAMILILGNICALIFGAITFSWFGDSIAAFGGAKYPGFEFLSFLLPLQKLQILDPMTDPMTMLYVSLALGFIQIIVGLLVAMSQNIKKGDLLAAFADQGGWIIFLVGLVLVGLSNTGVIGLAPNISAGIAILGAVILVLTQGRAKKNIIAKLFSGIMSLYNVTGFLGDVLSYSRLLALGLGSAAVGMVINLLVTLVAGVPYVGPVLGVVVFILGHLFGIAANILGAFVHSLRLQYVEFFGKFHEAAGTEFRPLTIATQYVKISEQ